MFASGTLGCGIRYQTITLSLTYSRTVDNHPYVPITIYITGRKELGDRVQVIIMRVLLIALKFILAGACG